MQCLRRYIYLSNLKFSYHKIMSFKISTKMPLQKTKSYNWKNINKFEKLSGTLTNERFLGIESILRKHRKVSSPDKIEIMKNIEICQENNICLRTLMYNTRFFRLNNDELLRRISILREMGANFINSAMIISLASDVSIISFKTFARIPKKVDIVKVLYSNLHKPPPEVPPLSNIDEFTTVWQLRQECLKHYFRWKLQLSKQHEEQLKYFVCRLKTYSYKNIKEIVDILHYDMEIRRDQLWNYKLFFKNNPENLRKILTEIKTICGISIIELLKKKQTLYNVKYENVKILKDFFECKKITQTQIIKAPEVLLKDAKKLTKEWKLISCDPKLKFFLNHPDILRSFILHESLSMRIKYLQYINVSNIKMNFLYTEATHFDKVINVGKYKKFERDINQSIIGLSEMTPEEIKNKLKKHPYWRQVNLSTIHNTFVYLQLQFELTDIKQNLPLILYSKDLVEEILTKLILTNKSADESKRYTSSQLLALCLYEIEKRCSFSGDGIWYKNSEQALLPTLDNCDKNVEDEIKKEIYSKV